MRGLSSAHRSTIPQESGTLRETIDRQYFVLSSWTSVTSYSRPRPTSRARCGMRTSSGPCGRICSTGWTGCGKSISRPLSTWWTTTLQTRTLKRLRFWNAPRSAMPFPSWGTRGKCPAKPLSPLHRCLNPGVLRPSPSRNPVGPPCFPGQRHPPRRKLKSLSSFIWRIHPGRHSPTRGLPCPRFLQSR